MKTIVRFILIDNDSVNNLLYSIVVKQVVGAVELQTFTEAEKALEYIVEEYADHETHSPTILFLDIGMPTWTGWDFLDHFEKLHDKIKSQISIYVLSSSLNRHDIDRTRSNKNVKDFIEKPLNRQKVESLLISPGDYFLNK